MKRLKIHIFTHVPFEGLGCIQDWISTNNHIASFTKFYESYQLPDPDKIDWLIVMGGPMGVYDEAIHPWLTKEKIFIRQMIEKSKTVLGICLGSQIIAEVLGAKVFPNKQKEIGWFDISITEDGKTLPILSGFKNIFPIFHWHGDIFDLPEGSKRLFHSNITPNQAFLYKENVLGLQFHFEVIRESLQAMVENGMHELIESESIQSTEQILSQNFIIEANNLKMYRILDFLAKNSTKV